MKTVHAERQAALKKTSEWLKQNKLTLNAEKTKTINFSETNRKKLNPQTVHLICQPIKRDKFFRYHGICIDEQLNFDKHVDFNPAFRKNL